MPLVSQAELMKQPPEAKHYPPAEEAVNVASHAVGFVLSIIALILLVVRAAESGSRLALVSFTIFGLSLVITYAVSTLYHSTRIPERRGRLRIMDHASIYVLIAGTYTPFTLITLQGMVGWLIFGISWSMALTGIVLKLFFTGRFRMVSTLMYVFMGWLILFAIAPLVENLHERGLYWLVAGGIAYSVGALLYSLRVIPFSHAMFHLLTMVGSACHFLAVFFYVLGPVTPAA